MTGGLAAASASLAWQRAARTRASSSVSPSRSTAYARAPSRTLTTSASTVPAKAGRREQDNSEWLGLRPLFGWCLRKLGQSQPPSFSLLLVDSGVRLLAQLLAQLRRLATGSLKHPLDLSLFLNG